MPVCASMSSGACGEPLSTATTCSPRACSARAAAMPERARPTTSHGPGGSGGRARAVIQATEAWYSVKPIALQIAAMIQKRRMIFVSDQPSSSKWWWIGAIRNGRLRNA